MKPSRFSSRADTDRDHVYQLAQKAVELDNDDASAHAALGMIFHIDGDMEAAISEYRLAIDLNPSLADSHHSLGAALIHSGRPEEALPHLEIAISLSPNDGKIGPFNARISMAHFCLQDYENAILWVRKAIRLPRVQWPTHAVLTSALAHIQRMDEAATELSILREMQPDISINFIQTHLPIVHQPTLDHLFDGLRKVGMPVGE